MAQNDLFSRGCLVQLATSAWTARVKVPPKALIENGTHDDVDPAFLAASKRLVDGQALKAIEAIRSEARSWLYSQSLPFPVDGAVFVPSASIEAIDAKLEGFKARFEAAIAAFVTDYPVLREAARAQLGSLYDPTDYPQNIGERFAFSWRFVSLAPPSEAQLLSPALVAKEREKFQNLLADATRGAVAELRTRFAACVDHVVDKLSGERDNGKPQIFRDSLVENLRDFVKGFEALNVCDDRALAELVDRTKGLIDGVDANDIRKDDALRARIAQQMDKVATSLDGMIVDRPARKVRLAPVKQAKAEPATSTDDGSDDEAVEEAYHQDQPMGADALADAGLA